MTLSLDDIKAAARRLEGHIERTPCRHSKTLSAITGAEVWVKFENLQFTASYKERGALNKLLQLTADEKKRGVIAASAGNHAQGLAYHGQRLGVPVTIVMPRGTPFVKVEQTREFGATVVIEGDSYDDANEHALQLERGARPGLRAPVRRRGRDGRPGHDRAGDAGGRAGPRDPAGADRRRRPDLRRRDGRQGDQTGHPHHRRRAGDVSLVHRPHARHQRARLGGQTIAEGIAVQRGRRPDLPDRPAADRRRAAAGGAVLRARHRALLQRREDRRRGRRRGLAGGAAGVPGAVPRQESAA